MSVSTDGSASREWRSGGSVVLAAMIGYSVASIPAGSTGVMMAPIEADLEWSRTQIYSGISLISFVNMLLATFVGAAIDRFGPRRIAIASITLVLGALALLSTTGDSMIGWWGRWVLVGIGVSAMPTVWVTAVATRFDKSRGLAVAVALSGSGIGTFMAPILTHWLIENYGWRQAYLGLAIAWALVTLPLILLFFHGSRSVPSAGRQGETSAPARPPPGLTAREGMRNVTFWKLLVAGAASTFGTVALVMNLFPMLESGGISRAQAAPIAGLVGIATIIGRISGGWLMDHFSAKWIAVGATASATILPLCLLLFPGSVAMATFGVLANGTMGGAKIGALAYLASRHLGSRALGTLYGAINAAIALSVASAPLAANYIFDLTNSYELVMWAALPVLAVATLIYLSLGAYPDYASETEEKAE